MKTALFFFIISSFLYSAGYKTYKMDDNIFKCLIPSDWKIERDASKDKETKIYKLVLINPSDPKTVVTLKYYSPQSGKKYEDFIQLNSKAADGRLETANEKYEKLKEITINDRKAFEINRKLKEFESMDSNLSYWLKERIIVIPAKSGFYTITFSSDERNFSKHKIVFDNILKTFRTLY